MSANFPSQTVHQNLTSDSAQSSFSSWSISTWPDERLWNCCRYYGEQARKWRNRFAGLLPEVFRRRLYERRGLGSIFEFAKKLAGMSEESVRLVLNLEKRFEDTPVLKNLLVDGAVSPHKLSRIASIATSENQTDLAQQVQVLPQSAVETYVRDYKIDMSQNALDEPKKEPKSLRAQTLQLSEEVTERLLELQEKGIDVNQLILNALNERAERIAQEKMRLAKEQDEKSLTGLATNRQPQDGNPTISRRLPAAIRHLLSEEYGTKCALPYCRKPSENIHHTQRFSLSKSHNPYFLAPLCEDHHAIAHSIDAKYVEARRGYG